MQSNFPYYSDYECYSKAVHRSGAGPSDTQGSSAHGRHCRDASRRLEGPGANALLDEPILPTLLRLTLPNLAAMLVTALVAIAETVYVGVLGTTPLAALALVFPMVMLMQMLSAGSMGGGVSSAISRALGAGDLKRAEALAVHALLIGAGAGAVFSVLFLAFGAPIFGALGGTDAVLAEALAYANVALAGAIVIWLVNTLASIVRGAGNMRVPSLALLAASLLQIVLGGTLGLGLGPVPRLGLAGVAAGLVIAYGLGALFLLWYLRSGRARITLAFGGARIEREMFLDILKVGAVASFSPLQSVLTVLILTRLVAGFGTDALAGYGIGARLEFLLVPIVFAVGVASVPMVGMAIGAGDVPRARRVAWTAGAVAAPWLVPSAWSWRRRRSCGLASSRRIPAWSRRPTSTCAGRGRGSPSWASAWPSTSPRRARAGCSPRWRLVPCVWW